MERSTEVECSKNADNSFSQKVFEDLQIDYPKDPVRFAKLYMQVKRQADDVLATDEDRTDGRQNLCLLDLAAAATKTKTGDREEAKIMYDDAMTYLEKLNQQPASKTTQSISRIARQVEKSL